jgi:acetylornithine deacetylase/succinyl-diaminopimelate desuccinylase-like protein
VSRPTFSNAHLAARAWLLERAAAAGLATRIDSAGKHSAVLRSTRAGAPTLLLGSHLDSVPDGGRFRPGMSGASIRSASGRVSERMAPLLEDRFHRSDG